MIKVIKDGRMKQVTCSNCNSVLEYADSDKTKAYYKSEVGKYGIYYTYNEWKNIITCPVCGKDVVVL